MSYRIVEAHCTGCTACEPLCPNGAIRESGRAHRIDPALCTGCEGFYDEPQCLAICPVPAAVVADSAGAEAAPDARSPSPPPLSLQRRGEIRAGSGS